jgi:hypothetical protein
MNKSALLELASRCEAATGPDRNIDEAISGIVLLPNGYSFPGCAPAYTKSLDAAMLLVPEGWGYCIEQERPSRAPEACLSPPDSEPWGHGSIDAEAATAPLAIVAAALRALAKEKGDDVHGEL